MVSNERSERSQEGPCARHTHPVSADPTAPRDFDVEERINNVRLKLADAMSDLRPLPTFAQLHTRLVAVAADLHQLEQDLLLVAHVSDLDQSGFNDELDAIAERLADGWEPPASPVGDVIDRLRSALPS
jgi:hypothetical protein